MSKSDFTAAEFADRLSRTRSAIAARGLDWMVLIHPVSIHWLTGSDGKSYQAFQCLLVSADDRPTVLLMRQSERAEMEADTCAGRVEGWGGNEPEDPLAAFERLARSLGLTGARVGIEVPAYYLHPHHYLRLKDILGTALVAEDNALLPGLKMCKSPVELAYVREAAAAADRAMGVFANVLREGASELELAADVYRSLVRDGGLAASTLNLVSGPRAAFSHGAPTERRVQRGDCGNIEAGGVKRRYTATIGRQFALGQPSARCLELLDIVTEASDAARAVMKCGTPAIEAHNAAKAVIARAGLDEFRIHTTGYGIAPGFAPAWGEPVNMFGGSTDILRAGMVISIEPPVFIPHEGIGARIIDNVLITETGAELLTTYPRGLIRCD